MNFKIKPLLIFSLCLISTIALARFCHHQTEGFRLAKIQHNMLVDHPVVQTNEEEKALLNIFLQKKFTFLGRGLQSFAFASEDGEYVLKIFNNRYQRKICFFSLLSHAPLIDHWAKDRATYYQGKLAKTFHSYQIAFSEMKDQTGLVFVHLHPTSDIPQKLTLIDKLNISHSIDPNQTGFLIQKRASLVYPTLKEYINKNDFEGAKQAISSLIDLFFWKWHHDILDNDPLIRTNYGFIDGKAIQIDVGPLSKQTTFTDMEQHRQEILRITSSLKFWLNENCPELIPFLDRELQKQLSS
jgi:hypothetical protein